MLDRLKSLPLTIFLTILIWMYAESQSGATHTETATLDGVPVLISGPPDALSRYQVVPASSTVSVQITGPQDVIETLRAQPPAQRGIEAHLPITLQDDSDTVYFRTLRIVTPPGTSVDKPPQVGFHLVEIKK